MDKPVEIFDPRDGSTQITAENGRSYMKKGSRLRYKSVTTVNSIVDKTDWFLPWVKSETVKHFAEHVTPDMSVDELIMLVNSGCTAYKRKNKRICDRGTRIHDWCECRVKGNELPKMEPGDEHFTKAFDKYFMDVYDVEAISTEERLFKDLWLQPSGGLGLADIADDIGNCQFVGYAGTYDFYGRINGKLTILDWKTSTSIHEENWMQLAAYVEADPFNVEQVGIVRMKPETKTPRCQIVFKDVSELAPYWNSFKKRLVLTYDEEVK